MYLSEDLRSRFIELILNTYLRLADELTSSGNFSQQEVTFRVVFCPLPLCAGETYGKYTARARETLERYYRE
jgi:hypothetical protein